MKNKFLLQHSTSKILAKLQQCNWAHFKLSLLFFPLFFSIVMLRNEASLSAIPEMLRSFA